LDDQGELRNGWLICTSRKSFAVYAATNSEKSVSPGEKSKLSMYLPQWLKAADRAWKSSVHSLAMLATFYPNCNRINKAPNCRKSILQ